MPNVANAYRDGATLTDAIAKGYTERLASYLRRVLPKAIAKAR
ncbi:hypothetical protein [Nocardia nova]